MTSPALELRGVTIGYQGTPVVHDVDLVVARGELVALLGANGSGKSTLVRGLLGLAQRLAGEIRILGQDGSLASVHRHIGYVPQHQSVRRGIPVTVREVVTSGTAAQVPPWRPLGRTVHARIDAALERVGLADLATRPITELSGGQQRRVLIARALAAAPDLLVLDEPTAGVDAPNQRLLAETLGQLVAEGITVVLITHELGHVDELASRVVVLAEGRVVFDGPPERSGDAAVDEGGDWHHPHGHEPATPAGIGPFG